MKIIVPLLTPLDDRYEPDEQGLRILIDFLLAKKIDGIFVLGTTGEFQFIKNRKKIIEITVEHVAGRCPVFAGVTDFSVEETIFRIFEAQNLQLAPDFLVIAPIVYHSNRKLVRHFERIEKFLQIPVYLYNNIGIVTRKLKRKDIIPGILEELSNMKKINGIKDSSGNLKYFKEITIFKNENFKILQGDEGLIVDSFLLKSDGIVPSMANIFPEIFIKLLSCLENGNMEKANLIQNQIKQIRSIYYMSGATPAVLKEYLRRRKVIKTSTSFCKNDLIKELTDELEIKIEQITVGVENGSK
ncbi:MAG: dihydrodipicolinate synthase family protein [Candidatus Ratteibacteria bacterium]